MAARACTTCKRETECIYGFNDADERGAEWFCSAGCLAQGYSVLRSEYAAAMGATKPAVRRTLMMAKEEMIK